VKKGHNGRKSLRRLKLPVGCNASKSRRRKNIRMEHPDSACKLSTNLYDIYQCCVYSEKLLMMDRGNVQNM
jgi:hypothetical protein